MEELERIVKEHLFFDGMDAELRTLVCGCAREVVFEAGSYLFREGEPADFFFLLRHGSVALQVRAPERGTLTFQTVGEHEIVGISWLIPPYRWTFDAKALELTRAIEVDARCLRQKCEDDHDLGYEMMKRFVPVLVDRLHATRMQILDLYGSHD
jgi:CRP-like cAMP-binding protein